MLHFSPKEISAIGEVITGWGEFEHWFDEDLVSLRASPWVASLEPKVPGPFKRRAIHFKHGAGVAFGSCRPLVERIAGIMNRALTLATHRNRLTHGIIFKKELMNDKDNTLIINIREKRILNIYTATLKEINELNSDINRLSQDLRIVFLGWGSGDIAQKCLASYEREALQKFHKTFLQNRRSPTGAKGKRQIPSFRS